MTHLICRKHKGLHMGILPPFASRVALKRAAFTIDCGPHQLDI